jgi:hypothetical protein
MAAMSSTVNFSTTGFICSAAEVLIVDPGAFL